MDRRKFMALASLLGLTATVKAATPDSFEKHFREVRDTIAAVQEHMFPEGTALPSAKKMHATQFLFETVAHKTYDRDIRAFVIDGAKEFNVQTKGRFVTLSPEEKEKALRTYEESSYGRNWLSRIMTLTMEGMFGDPIYGSNTKEAGWQALHAFGGRPRPKSRYIAL